MKPYPSYKGSGVEWIGKIPSHWQSSKIKFLSSGDRNSFIDGDWIESPYITDDGIRLVQTGNVGIGYYKVQGFRYITEDTFDELNCTEVLPNDVLICRLASPVGRACLAPDLGKRMITAVDNCILKPSTAYDPRFIVYQLSIKQYLEYLEFVARGSTRARISRSMLGDFGFVAPKLSEQQAIAEFLDRKTTQIDTLIDKKQRQIDLLKEQRTALINQAVTKGLDPNVPMKDSGIERLGEIPEYWQVKRFKYCATIKSGQVDPKEEPYKSMILVAPNHIESITGRLLYTQTAGDQSAVSGKYLYQEGDVLYSKIRPELRKACLSTGEGLCSADMYPITPADDLLAEFLLYLLLSNSFSMYATERSMRVAMPKVNREALSEYSFAYPEPLEQKEILDFITKQTEKTDWAIDKSEREIELLQEYRMALISSAVTGKIDVRVEKTYKGAVLIIGSLWWDNSEREKWRKDSLDAENAFRVFAPIRYGRLSKNGEKKGTYTMVVSPTSYDQGLGTALLVPLSNHVKKFEDLKLEAMKLWKAEGGWEHRISGKWGAVGLLSNPNNTLPEEFVTQWKLLFKDQKYIPTFEKVPDATLINDGVLNTHWITTVKNSEPVGFDFILVTVTEPETQTGKYPTALEIAQACNKHNYSKYFRENRRYGITTFQDEEIEEHLKSK